MKKSKVVSLRKIRIFDLKVNRFILILSLFFCLGLFLGTILYVKNSGIFGFSKNVFDFYLSLHNKKTWYNVFFKVLAYYSFVFILVFLSGASLMGTALVPSLIVFLGFVFSVLSSYLYGNYSIKGIAFNAVVLIPSVIVFLITVIFSAREALSFSILLSRLTMPRSRPINLYLDFKNYCGRFLILFVFLVLSVIIDTFFSCSFMNYFGL